MGRFPPASARLLAVATVAACGALCASAAAALPAREPGLHVDRAGALNYPGTILDVDRGQGSYKVQMDGGEITWMSAGNLRHSCEGLRGGARSASFYAGEWNLFMSSYPRYETRGSDVYLVVEPGAEANPVEIFANGTYRWRTFADTIEGYWQALAPGEDKYRKGVPAILLLAGEDGADWQMWSQGEISADNHEQVTLERWDMGVSYLATRAD